MIEKNGSSGFVEVEHTADWAIKVWADRLDDLFSAAAAGMYALMDVQVLSGQRTSAVFRVNGIDPETFLVGFLSELLYRLESDRIAFNKFDLRFNAVFLEAHVDGAPVISQNKEIKAATYHNLKIRQVNGKYETTIVFDV
jgi:SHS2 domain-containing protein